MARRHRFNTAIVRNWDLRGGKTPLKPISKSKSARESQSEIHCQKLSLLSLQIPTYGVFDCEFDFNSQEWVCFSRFKSETALTE